VTGKAERLRGRRAPVIRFPRNDDPARQAIIIEQN